MLTAQNSELQLSRALLDVLIRAGLIVVLVVYCYRIFHPFLDLMLWSLILAVTLYPLHRMLKRRLGSGDSTVASLIVVLSIAVLLVPVYLLGASITESVQAASATVKSGTFHVPPPPATVADWPLVGDRLHAAWGRAATDLAGLTQQFAPQLKAAVLGMLRQLAGLGVGLLIFIVALILAGIFMAYGEAGARSAVQIASRLFGSQRGQHITELCTATIRAVAQGVVGIAFIQMVLVGLGFVLMGVPGAGLLALAVLLFGIMQLPATLITVPVIAFVIATQGANGATITFSIYVFLAGLIDNVLKPLLLGRGLSVPMPVILLGALGGMVTGGIIGLFIGPVVLGVGYELFWEWVEHRSPDAAPVAPVTPVPPLAPGPET